MKLVFRGHDDRYAVEQSLLAFFPEERPVYQAPEPGEDDWARVDLHQSPVYATAITEIAYGSRLGRGMSRALLRGVDDEYERERLRQKAVKLSFFKAAREITGLTPAWGALTGIRPGKLAARLLEEGKTPAQARRILGDTYYVSPSRRRLAVETAQAGLRAKADLRPEDISLYIGIPFCPTRCAYCSFVSQSVEKSLGLVEPYLDVLCREITDAAQMVRETGLRIKSFYMGGGTPTTLSAQQMDRLLTHLNRSFDLSGCVEYCIEAGRPDTITRDKLQVLLDHGADRISVNPQSLEDEVLRAIGRRHTARDIEDTMALAASMGFPHVNMDLIAGLPADTPEGFRRTLDTCPTFGRENIPGHPLSPKKGSRHPVEGLPIPSAEDVAAMRLVTSMTLVTRQLKNAIAVSAVIVLAILVFTVMSGLYFVRSIVVPLGQVERTAASIARGELDVRLPVTGDQRDEVDRLRGTINQMAEGLEETEKMKNEFISSVSHELRTPLTSIRGWVETLRALNDPADENYRKGLEIINNETVRLYNMVEELLDFSRLQNGRIQMNNHPLDLVAELTDAVLFCEARIRQEGMILSYTEPEEMIPVYADPDRLRQVFINILDNAIKYSAPGGRITVKLWKGQYKAFIEIIDQGRGIPPEDLENVKTKFYKGSNSVRGSGIGLALVDSIMTALDGTLDIKSTLGRGTVVTLGLPLYQK